jgi:hypothetical protein
VSGLTVTSGVYANQLSWDSPERCAVYGSTTNNRGAATKLGVGSGGYTHIPGNNLVWYYWVTAINRDDYEAGTWTPSNITGGLQASEGKIDLAKDITGKLATHAIDGLGALALLNSVDASQVNNLGKYATANYIVANDIISGTLNASIVNVTNLNANNISTGTIQANRIDVDSLTVKRVQTKSSGARVSVGAIEGGMNTDSVWCISSTGAVTTRVTSSGIYCAGTGLIAGGIVNGLSSSSSKAGGFFESHSGSWFKAAYGSYGYQMSGAASPFTGAHEGMTLHSNLTSAEIGDIFVDLDIVKRHSVSDVITTVEPSSHSYQKGSIGVLMQVMTDTIPAVFTEVVGVDGTAPATNDEPARHTPDYGILLETHTAVSLNALGEGQVNVCGQNGNIEIGDLIVTSDMPGKGMKQDDDIVRNYTVAKSRERVIFNSPDEIKQIACIYMCG